MQMEEEALQKRKTDCVYFLASPLTCKKGIECEYRHNEMARLNPRDCWYWLASKCLNPTCAFRHPPLEHHAQQPSQSASSLPAKKAPIPCFFYFNAFCNKGHTCSFLHGPPYPTKPTATTANSVKKPSPTITFHRLPLDNNKTSLQNHTPTQPHFNPFQTPPKAVPDLKFHPKNRTHPSPSPLIPVSQFEKVAALKSDSLFPPKGFIQSRSRVCTDQTSEVQMDDCFGPEDRLESSPGFDVLVDEKSENLDYEDDGEYLLAIESDHRELNNHFLEYDREDPVNSLDAQLFYKGEMYDSVNYVDNVHVFDDVRNNSGHSRDGILDSLLSWKRKRLSMELPMNDQRAVDLRDHLRKRRLIDVYPSVRSSRRHDSSRRLGQSRKRPQRHGTIQRLHGRLASKVERNAIESLGDNGTLSSGANQRGQCYRKKKQFLSSEVSGKLVPRERGHIETSTSFKGPKTLAQIKEEKKKAEENGDCYGRTTSADFESPKSLSEILKDKIRLASKRDCHGNSSN